MDNKSINLIIDKFSRYLYLCLEENNIDYRYDDLEYTIAIYKNSLRLKLRQYFFKGEIYILDYKNFSHFRGCRNINSIKDADKFILNAAYVYFGHFYDEVLPKIKCKNYKIAKDKEEYAPNKAKFRNGEVPGTRQWRQGRDKSYFLSYTKEKFKILYERCGKLITKGSKRNFARLMYGKHYREVYKYNRSKFKSETNKILNEYYLEKNDYATNP